MKRGFDNSKYIDLQSQKIRDRISKFGDKLYLEFGGKLFDDYHAARVLPGFEPNAKVKIRKEAARHFSEVSEYTDFFDVADYTNKIFGMYTGNIQTIELCCKKKLAKTVVDRFSENIFITNVTDDEFCFSYKAAVSDALVTFLLNFGDEIRVINPQNLKEMIANRAEKVINMYKS